MKREDKILIMLIFFVYSTQVNADNLLSLAQKILFEATTKPIEEMGERMQKNMIETKYINENPDLLDMPPWNHENKWNRISKPGRECWFHKKSLKKICR